MREVVANREVEATRAHWVVTREVSRLEGEKHRLVKSLVAAQRAETHLITKHKELEDKVLFVRAARARAIQRARECKRSQRKKEEHRRRGNSMKERGEKQARRGKESEHGGAAAASTTLGGGGQSSRVGTGTPADQRQQGSGVSLPSLT